MTTRRNLATNPGFELDTDYDGIADGFTDDKSTTGSWPYSLGARLGANGQYSQRISYVGVAGDTNKYIAPTMMTPPGSVAAGDVVTVSMAVKGSWSGLTNLYIWCQYLNSSNAPVGDHCALPGLTTSPISAATRVSATMPAAGATTSRLRINFAATGIDNGDTLDFYIDDILIEKSTVLGPYFDGSSQIPGFSCSWDGVYHASASLQVTSQPVVPGLAGEWARQGVILSASEAWEYGGGEYGYLLQAKMLPLGAGWQCWYVGHGGGIGYATAPSPLGPWVKYQYNPLPMRCIDPDVVLVDGIYHMFGTVGPYVSIVHCTSADGVTWGNVDTALAPAGDWESGQGGIHVADPCVLQGADGTWYMYHLGAGTLGVKIGVATSASILGPWTEWGGNPFTFLNNDVVTALWKPFVRVINGIYYMWFHGSNDTGDDIYRAHAGGPLGPWTFDDPQPTLARTTYDEGVGLTGSQVSDPSVVWDGNQYCLIYTATRNANLNLASAVIKAATLPPVHIATPFARTVLTLDGLDLNDGTVYGYLPGVELGARQKSWSERKSYTGAVAQYNVSEAASIPMKFPMMVQGASLADLDAKVAAINTKIDGCSSASPKDLVFAGATYQIGTTPSVGYVLDDAAVVAFRALIDLVLNRVP